MAEHLHWADQMAARVVAQRGPKEHYTCASGITPSGVVHIGNFREIISVDLIVRALRDAGQTVRFIYSWDDYDVFRKIPSTVADRTSYESYLRLPITAVPDPGGVHESYARANEAALEAQLPRVGVRPEFIYQAQRYQAADYAAGIRRALERRDAIRAILDRYRTTALSPDWWPVQVFSAFTGKDTTTIVAWDGEWGLTYRCEETGKQETVDLRETGLVKLPWRVDWPMRWSVEQVDFEPAGKEHHSEGGSFDTAKYIVQEIYDAEPPATFKYDFIRIKGRGGKMSSSSGDVISLSEMLEVYQPEIVRYLFAGTRPNAEFAISFDLDVIKIYEDYDRCERIYFDQETVNAKRAAKERRSYELSQVDAPPAALPFQLPFRHLCNVLLIHNGDVDAALGAMPGFTDADPDLTARARTRAACAWHWLNTFAPEDFRFTVATTRNPNVVLTAPERAAIVDLRALALSELDRLADRDLQNRIYDIAREHQIEAKDLFVTLYRILVHKERGPRLGGFLLTLGGQRVAAILEPYCEAE